MPVFQIDVQVYATAYIRADSAEAAKEIARTFKGLSLEVIDMGGSEIAFSSLPTSDPRLPAVSLSPCLSVYGPDPGAMPELTEEPPLFPL